MTTGPRDSAADEASLFLALPWPTAAIDSLGYVMAANPAFTSVFPACRPGTGTVDDFLGAGEDGRPASAVLPAPEMPGESWQGNWPAMGAMGEGNYRFMINRDSKNPDVRWVFLPENPVISGQARLTPRSELEITRMVLEHSPDFLFLRDNNGGFIFASRTLTRFIGVPSDGYEAGKTLAVFLTPECTREFDRLDRETLAKRGPTVRQRFRFAAATGSNRLVDLTQEPVYNKAGNLLCLLTFARDITATVDRENKLHFALEEARTAGQAKGFFVANVSHEIRTPINGILGMAELCLDTTLSVEQRKYVQAVLDCGRTLLTLVNDILDFSKIESGRLTFEAIEFDLVALIAEAASQFASKAHSHGVEVVIDTDPALPTRFRGDPTRLRQIVYNLVSNAIKFTRHGHVVVAVRLVSRSDERMRLALDIADTGIGIPEDKCATIFEAFTQADATTTRRFGGTGLGLAIVKRLTELMAGTLTVKSQPGVGSVFTAELELEVARERDAATAHPLAGHCVGILSEDAVQRETLARALRGLGARVETSAGGVDAFRLVLTGATGPTRTELLIADYPVGRPTGHDMVDLIVGRAASTGIPVITLAGVKTEPRSLARLQSLPHRHLTKPSGTPELRAIALGLLGLIDPEESEAAPALAEPGRILRILLAEDNPVNQELALRRLEKLGHQVDLADDGGVAWQLLTSKRYDVALLDVQMPVLDGIRLARRIREMETGSPVRLPLVALTALAMEEDKRDCLAAGFDDFLTKPFLLEDLRKMLARMVTGKAAGAHHADVAEPAGAPNATPRPTPVMPMAATRPPFAKLRATFDFEAVLHACSEAESEDLLAAGEVFLSYWEKETTALNDARERNAPATLAMLAHRIKGGVGALQAKAAQEACAALELAVKHGPAEEIDNLLRRLVDELQSTADGIRKALDSHRAKDESRQA